MLSLVAILPFALVLQVHGTEPAANPNLQAPDSSDKVIDTLVDKMVNRGLKLWPLHHGGLDDATLAKALPSTSQGNLHMSRSSFPVPLSTLPAHRSSSFSVPRAPSPVAHSLQNSRTTGEHHWSVLPRHYSLGQQVTKLEEHSSGLGNSEIAALRRPARLSVQAQGKKKKKKGGAFDADEMLRKAAAMEEKLDSAKAAPKASAKKEKASKDESPAIVAEAKSEAEGKDEEKAEANSEAEAENEGKSSDVDAEAQDEDEFTPRKGTFKRNIGGTSGVKVDNIWKSFKMNTVLKGVSWEVKKGERVGLVGFNGAGKTTQLRIITGDLEADEGEVYWAKKDMHVAWLTQEFEVQDSHTVRQEFESAFGEAKDVKNRLEALQQELETVGEDLDRMGEILNEMDKLQKKSKDTDVDKMGFQIDKMMPQLGFKPEDADSLVASFSGGWKMRMSLGKILLQEPDLLLLDEPTNHLDIETIQWLENYLREQTVPMVVVSHDREFLDSVCNKIVETELGKATTYMGNYEQYKAQKREAMALQLKAYEEQQKEIEKQTDMIHRLSGGDQAGRATAAKKALEKIKSEDTLLEKPYEFKKRRFTFPQKQRCGELVARVDHVTHGYGNKMLFDDVNLEINRGDRVAILGPNGAGKSTLFRLITGREKPIMGTAMLGHNNIVPNYFVQNQAEELDMDMTALTTLVNAASDETEISEIKALLGQMLFSGPAMDRKVEALSGGEKARLALAKFMLTPATVLILDEPTNHLDIPSKEVLEDAIKMFNGAVIAISHDRYFLRQIANRIVEVKNNKLVDYKGDYKVFMGQSKDAAKIEKKKQEKRKEVEKSTIKAKSKMSKAEKALLKKEKARSFQKAKR